MGIATTTQTAAIRDLSDQNSQGTRMGVTAADQIGFYGVSSCVNQGNVNSRSISSGALASSLAFQLNRLGLIQCTSFAA